MKEILIFLYTIMYIVVFTISMFVTMKLCERVWEFVANYFKGNK